MNCPVCGREMKKGVLATNGSRLGWMPERKSRFLDVTLGKMQDIGTYPLGLLGPAEAPDAYFCENCKKVTGIFDVVF